MAVVHSNESWEDYALHWPRLKRELLNVIELGKQRQRQQADVPGSNSFPVPFYNASGETIPAYAVMRVTGVSTLGSVPVITVAKPSSAFQRLYLVNGPLAVSGESNQEPNFGTWAEGAAFVLYDDANTPAYGESWGASNGSWKIKKYRYGFTILGNPASGVVGASQEFVNSFLGKASGAIAGGGTGTVLIHDGNEADTSDTMASVKNRTSVQADDQAWVKVNWLGGKWFLEPWTCPA